MTVVSESAAPSLGAAPATLRGQVTVSLRFPDGFTATAEVLTFRGRVDGKEHLSLAPGEWQQALLDQAPGPGPLVRLHSECLTGDVFGSERCDCGPQLREAVEQIAQAGGFLLYLRQEGGGIGLYSKLDAYALQDAGLDTYEANRALGHGEDERDYSAAAQMLGALDASTVRLLSNNPDKAAPPAPDQVLGRIDKLVPRLRERAGEAETRRRIPESTIEELKDAGVFNLLSPKGVGGFGMGVETYAQAIRRLARGCASTAWTAGHLIEHVWMLARWPQEVQAEVFANGPAPLAAATGAPVGVAERVPGGYAISGLWSFASGVMHSGWVLLAVQHGTMRLQCLVPISEVEVLDVWHTAGLRGTGSNDIRAEKLFVPGYRTLDWALLSAADNPGSRIHPDPIVHTAMAPLLNMVAPSAALGAAEYAVELFRDRMLVRKVKNTSDSRQADSPIAQARYSQAAGLVVTARLHWEEAITIVSTANERRAPVYTDEERARYRLSLALSGEASGEAVRLVMAGSGGSAHRLSHPLQRIQRDVNVLLNHPTLAMDPILEQAGRGLLGLGFTVPVF